MLLTLGLFLAAAKADGQGTMAFQNLDFESANLAGYAPGPNTTVPIIAAFPGWSAKVGNVQMSQVQYDDYNIAGGSIAIMDSHTTVGFAPLQGSYSAFLMGADITEPNIPASISQTGFIPTSTRSLVVGMQWELLAPIIEVDGQPITMFPVKTYPNYTIYAGNIAAFAGKTATLSFTAPGATAGGPNPSFLELDNIIFSTASIPEPRSVVLLLTAGLFAVWCRSREQAMKRASTICLLVVSLLFGSSAAMAQGTMVFQNLDFESANVAGYFPDAWIPVSAAIPGWGASQPVSYDSSGFGGILTILTDSLGYQMGTSPAPLQGNYSVILLTGPSPQSASISQTGLVPAGTKSLLVDMSSYMAAPVVALDGQSIAMVPIKDFPTYTEYAGRSSQ